VKVVLGRFLPVDHFTPADRRLSFLMWAMGVCQGYLQSTVGALIPFIRQAFGVTEGTMSGLIALTRLGTFLALPLGLLADRRGRRGAFLIAFVMLSVAGPTTAFVGDTTGFVALQALVRAATAALAGLGVVLLVEQVTPRVRAYGVAIYGAGGSLGAGLAILSLNLADRSVESWRTPFWLGFAALGALPLLWKGTSESRVFEGHRPHAFRELVKGDFGGRFGLTSAAFFMASVFSTVALTFSTERLVNDLGLATGAVVGISLVGGTIGGTGFFLGGRLADQWGRRPASVLAICLATLGGMGIYWLADPFVVTLAVVVGSFGSFAFVPASSTHRAELFPTGLRASAQTAAANVAMLGSATGLGLAGLLIDEVGLSATIGWLAIAPLGAIVCTLLLPETKGTDLTTG